MGMLSRSEPRCGLAAVVLLFLVTTGSASAAPITLAVEPSIVNRPPVVGFFEFDFFFGDQLDGLDLDGQSISLDFVFSDEIIARILHAGAGLGFDALLVLETNAGTFPGFFGDASTGFLLGPNGTPLHAPLDPEWVGRVTSSDGSLGIGLFPQLDNFDMSGVHYDLTLPTGGYVVTGGFIRLASNQENESIQFGTVAQLPEPSTLMLLGAALVCTGGGIKARSLLRARFSRE
jgi:hypothetical protein